MRDKSFMQKLLGGGEVQWLPLHQIAQIKHGKDWKHLGTGDVPVYGSGGVMGRVDTPSYDKPSVLIPRKGSITNIFYVEEPFWNVDTIFYTDIDTGKIVPKYLYHFLKTIDLLALDTGSGRPSLTQAILNKLLIPIPTPHDPRKSLAVQAEIVRILEKFIELTAELTAELEGRRRQYTHYRDKLLSFNATDVEWKTLGEVFDIYAGGDAPKNAMSKTATNEYDIPIFSNGIGDNSLYGWTNKAKIKKPSITVSARGTIGWTSYRDKPFVPIVRLLVLTPRQNINAKFAYYFMKAIEDNYNVPTSGIPQLTKPMIEGTLFPIPYPNDLERSLAEQARVVAILDKFDTLTTSLSDGLPQEIELRQKQYRYYRDLLLSFPKSEGAA